ncbi:hypothetical protein SynMVIR181_01035 [Synechococcus sp. MVIR-18-1]|nr:hypothetical protein SynMVIR181_01035 [Synechococcus sp. MVIR-18-1]
MIFEQSWGVGTKHGLRNGLLSSYQSMKRARSAITSQQDEQRIFN